MANVKVMHPTIISRIFRTLKRLLLLFIRTVFRAIRHFLSVIFFSVPVGTVIALTTAVILVFLDPGFKENFIVPWWIGWIVMVAVWAVNIKELRKKRR